MDFAYLGERIRERAGLADTHENRTRVRRQMDLVFAEIRAVIFELAKRFPPSRMKEQITRAEGRQHRILPMEVNFGEYQKRWWEAMSPGMSASKVRDYTSSLNAHLVPFFGGVRFSELNSVLIRKFIASLSSRRSRKGKALSGKRMQNILIPLMLVFQDACVEVRLDGTGEPLHGAEVPSRGQVPGDALQPERVEARG